MHRDMGRWSAVFLAAAATMLLAGSNAQANANGPGLPKAFAGDLYSSVISPNDYVLRTCEEGPPAQLLQCNTTGQTETWRFRELRFTKTASSACKSLATKQDVPFAAPKSFSCYLLAEGTAAFTPYSYYVKSSYQYGVPAGYCTYKESVTHVPSHLLGMFVLIKTRKHIVGQAFLLPRARATASKLDVHMRKASQCGYPTKPDTYTDVIGPLVGNVKRSGSAFDLEPKWPATWFNPKVHAHSRGELTGH